jgi:hypothetical protein
MKKLVFIIIFVLMAVYVFCQSPCAIDTAGNGRQIKWYSGAPSISPCPLSCEMNQFICVQVAGNPDSFSGEWQVGAKPTGLIEVRFVQHCRFLLLDTCVTAGDPIMNPYYGLNTFPVNTQVCVYWNTLFVDSVSFYAKTEPSGASPELGPILMDTDTCGSFVGVLNPIAEKRYYRSFLGLELVEKPLARGMYYECGSPYGDCRKIFVTKE